MGSKIGVIKVAAKRTGYSFDEYTAFIQQGLKYCTKCKKWKDRSYYYKDSSRGDGLKACCVDCDYKPTKKNTPRKRERRAKLNEGLKYCSGCNI